MAINATPPRRTLPAARMAREACARQGLRVADGAANAACIAGQEGSAAIEFALVSSVLLALLFGVLAYGALFWVQQKVAHLAGDGARYAVAASLQGAQDPAAAGCSHVQHLWQQDALLQSVAANASQYVCAYVQGACDETAPSDPCLVVFTVTCPVTGWPLLNALRGLAGVFTGSPDALLPSTLTARASVRVPGMNLSSG